jgi:aspartyl-tRNA(Asn)/glutamyl-tRNA(Gln) amidotransferase subunit A
MISLTDLSASEIARRVRSRALSAVEVVQAHLDRISSREPAIDAFLHVFPERALGAARKVDEAVAAGGADLPLAGVPVAVKDVLDIEGFPTTCGSRILEGYRPPFTATAVARLEAAGAIPVGKTNLDEFAMGSSTEHSAFGPTKNPWDTTRTPGGSSGGSAVAVAARMTCASLGSDTGGSIRQPAAFTGVVGVKPTYGRVSRYGLVAFASSLDQVGPFATDVRGAARVLTVIAGKDACDATSLPAPVEQYETACDKAPTGIRIGIPEEYFGPGLDPSVAAAVRAATSRLEHEGCILRPVTLPHTRFAVATYYVLANAEASSNLARFDGVRYGLRVERSRSLRQMYGDTRDAGFGAEVKRRILLGTFVLSAGYYDAYYRKAQKVRTLIRRDFERAFQDVDAIACPTTPTCAFRLGEKMGDPLAMYLSDVYTLPASLAGIPAISVPCGMNAEGLPIGLQLLAPALSENTLFTLASAVERLVPGTLPGLATAPVA